MCTACIVELVHHSTSSGTEKRVRFLRNSPSMKVMFPCKGLTSPDRAGSKTQETDTSPKWPLFLTTGYTAEGGSEHTEMNHLDIKSAKSPKVINPCIFSWHFSDSQLNFKRFLFHSMYPGTRLNIGLHPHYIGLRFPALQVLQVLMCYRINTRLKHKQCKCWRLF